MDSTAGIRAFWEWWETARHRVLRAIEVDRNFSPELVEDISNHVAAIADLDWELGAGTTSRHAFFLSPKGNPELRLVTELWRTLGPPGDEEWSYFPARQPRRGCVLEFEDVRFDTADLRVQFEVEEARERVHGAYFHPGFSKVEKDARVVALFLMLDGELGEDGVERWLGSIDVLDTPEDAVPFAEFRKAVDELARTANGEKFAVFEGEADGKPLFFSANLALKRIDHLLHTNHLAVTVAILDQNPHGLPTNADAEQLNEIENQLTTALGNHAVYFGRETRPGRRVMHFYTPEDSAAQRIVGDWVKANPTRTPDVMFAHDPTWDFVKRF